ncbi:hypothetical protein GGX14DRAFT_610917 [Mycena pura]|uniref:DUF6533 domain-containing protein n=1 Tax=Mycena pura TaxID=153505 RepID=A0AAD6YHS0_9AGAR|nr:hypothetical protein GGX14DRAFT_610917 [Mycena pura]
MDAALLIYDYFVTLEWEASRYWHSGISSLTVLFFANRYGTLLGNVPVVLLNFWTAPASPSKDLVRTVHINALPYAEKVPDVLYPSLSPSTGLVPLAQCRFSCRDLYWYHESFIIVIQIVIAVLLILRTYALYERNNRVLGFMFLFSVGVICTVVWSTIDSDHSPTALQGIVSLDMGCAYSVTQAESKGMIIAWSALGLFDCMIFLLTLYKTLSRHIPTGPKLLTVLMRDGCLYFGVMVISNLCNILSYALGTVRELCSPLAHTSNTPASQSYTRGLFNTSTNIISSLMITRLMLNIRDPALARDASCDSQEPSAVQWAAGVFSTYQESVQRNAALAADWV